MKRLIKLLNVICLRLSFERAGVWGRWLGWWIGTVFRYRRTEVMETLQRCFLEKSAVELRGVADGMYENLAHTVIETLRLDTIDREWVDRHVEMKGIEIVREALARGKGAIILTAHIGNFQLPSMIACFLGIPIAVVTKALKPAALNDYWTGIRSRFGVKSVARRGTFRACLAALKANETLGFILDQNMKRNQGIFVDFFGRPACTTPGLALLSAVSGSPVIPVFTIRRSDGNYRIDFMPALPPPPDRNPETIRQATQTYTSIIESVIRKYPDQWIWIHRRWRTQPLPEPPPVAAAT